MPTRSFEFLNQNGIRLSGSLEMPEGIRRGWALFAHCFTCGKNNLAAVRIARELASVGIGVLRFDFTGLGDSEGSFADASFSLNLGTACGAVLTALFLFQFGTGPVKGFAVTLIMGIVASMITSPSGCFTTAMSALTLTPAGPAGKLVGASETLRPRAPKRPSRPKLVA